MKLEVGDEVLDVRTKQICEVVDVKSDRYVFMKESGECFYVTFDVLNNTKFGENTFRKINVDFNLTNY